MLAFKDGPRVRLIAAKRLTTPTASESSPNGIAALKAPTLILHGEVCAPRARRRHGDDR
jgi:hypothetical protein